MRTLVRIILVPVLICSLAFWGFAAIHWFSTGHYLGALAACFWFLLGIGFLSGLIAPRD